MKGVIINRAEDCTVKQFEDCQFRNKYKVLLIEGNATDKELKEAFEYIYLQYVDLSGLYLTREFEMSAYIHSLNGRIDTVKNFLSLQRQFIDEFNVPFKPAFGLVKRYGHTLYWNPDYPDIDLFLRKLDRMENKESKYEAIRDTKMGELFEFRRKHIKKEYTQMESRKEFIIMQNRLQQAKFVIDKSKTTVEELALMIYDHRDQVETEKMNANNKGKR